MRYRYGIYALIVLALATAPWLFDDMDFGLTVINLIIWPIVIIGAVVVAIRTPRYSRSRGSRRRRIGVERIASLKVPARYQLEHTEAPALVEYSKGSV